MFKNCRITSSFAALSLCLASSTVVLAPQPSHAFDFKKGGKVLKRDFKKVKKKLKKSGTAKRIIQGVGVGLIAGGIADRSAGMAILGVVLVAAPEIFKEDMARQYGNDWQWSGCTSCGKKRIVVVPGRTVNDTHRKATLHTVKEDVKDVQRALKRLGLYSKRIDGDFGPGTRAGVKEFQRSLNSEVTGYLTAEQRYRLFIQAGEKGYTRTAALNTTNSDLGEPIPVKLAPVATKAPEPTIPEYRLAKSQFSSFSANYLKYGELSVVKETEMLSDGRVRVTLIEPNAAGNEEIVGPVDGFAVRPHQLSDQWIEVLFSGEAESQHHVVNVRDDFSSTEDAAKWVAGAEKRIFILSKLTGLEPVMPAATRVAEAPPTGDAIEGDELPADQEPVNVPAKPDRMAEAEVEPKSPEKKAGLDGKIILTEEGTQVAGLSDEPIGSAEEAGTPVDGSAGAGQITETETVPNSPERKAGRDGKIVLTDLNSEESDTVAALPERPADTGDSTGSATDTRETAGAESEPEPAEKTAGPDGKIVLTGGQEPAKPGDVDAQPAIITADNRSAAGSGYESGEVRSCRQNIYVSFTFPDGERPISHYNITPPENTLMMDNGDSTAYFTGTCVQGRYGFKYVYVLEGQSEKDWKHYERAGEFQIASNSEQCSVDLNTPDGSASLDCF